MKKLKLHQSRIDHFLFLFPSNSTMALIHRKMGDPFARTKTSNKYESCDVCYFCPYDCTNYSSPPPPPPPTTSHHQFPTVLMLMICGLGVVLLLFSYLVFVRYRSMLRNSRRTLINQSPELGNTDGSLNENNIQGPVMDHHVWYIRTVGLPQSLIDSIPIFDYRRREKMVQGSDHCPVCLSEFQENESLRLLPDCSHAFHMLCIDTWLRSHKNCPVCRSPVSINNTSTSAADTMSMMGSDHSGSIQRPPEFESNGATDTRAAQETGGESRMGLDKMARVLSKKRPIRVLSDLSDRRVQEVDPVRRAVSMDYSSDSVLVEIHENKFDEGCSET